jgi:sulfide:quinone oxidoreductase
VTTDGGTYDADVLVVGLGADYDTAATPGLDEVGVEFYSMAGAVRARDVLRGFDGGRIVIGVLGGFFKCPPAPNEAALMLHDPLVAAGTRDASSIALTSPMPMPIPISREVSSAIEAMLAGAGVEYSPSTLVTRLDPATRTAHTNTGRELPFDLFLGIPVHRAPEVVVSSGLTDDGWIGVDPATFATRWPNVYAVGDITNAPVPRAGAIAEGEAGTVADGLIARIRGDAAAPPPYSGVAMCYLESGDSKVATVDVDFYASGGPTALFTPPSVEGAALKRAFGATRRARWFGYDA